MNNGTKQYALTAEHLKLHDESLQRQNPNVGTISWAEKVIKEEHIHQLHEQQGMHFAELQIPDTENHNNDNRPSSQNHKHHPEATEVAILARKTSHILELFDQTQGQCLEEPIERFLTPDGCSDPPGFARRAMAESGVYFGDAGGIDERKRMAEANVRQVVRGKKLGECRRE